jgi:hypothetical protein
LGCDPVGETTDAPNPGTDQSRGRERSEVQSSDGPAVPGNRGPIASPHGQRSYFLLSLTNGGSARFDTTALPGSSRSDDVAKHGRLAVPGGQYDRRVDVQRFGTFLV